MTNPTREEVEAEIKRWHAANTYSTYSTNELPDDDLPVRIFQAYLAQEEELRLERHVFQVSDERNTMLITKISALESESQELHNELKRLNRYIEKLEVQP